MNRISKEEKQPWAGCFLSHVLVTYMEETWGKQSIDYPSLFRGIPEFEAPLDPVCFLKEVGNWVPLRVLRNLLSQCEELSGKKDIAYHAARAHFEPSKKQPSSLFDIMGRALNDVRSLFVYADLWASVQTNYLKFQSFERQGTQPDLYLLTQFQANARPSVGSMHFLRGICEGFIRLCSFIDDGQFIEELSQLQIEDIIREFPAFDTTHDGDCLLVRHRSSRQVAVEAVKVPLRSEVTPISHEFTSKTPNAMVVFPQDGLIPVFTLLKKTDRQRTTHAAYAYKIMTPGVVSDGALSYSFKADQVYNAPYSRFRVIRRKHPEASREISVDCTRNETVELLFAYLNQAREARMRPIECDMAKRKLAAENTQLRREIEREYSFAGIVGKSERIQEPIGMVRSIAATDVTVLIQGETGTGKELIARAIHHNSSRRLKRFVAVNCGSLTETLLESELFGHEKGAFTGAMVQRKGIFEVADGGTLFFDEVGEIPPSTQVKLLRVLQEGEFHRVGGTDPIKVNVRIVAATNQNLETLITEGRFRKDLYYRLNVVPVTVPPLRERVEDIPLLVSHFIDKCKRQLNKSVSGMSPQAMALIMAYGWPGNVRELENVIQRMMVISRCDLLDVQDLPTEIRGKEMGSPARTKDLKDVARTSAGLAEKSTILDALAESHWNVTHTARSLGVSRATLQTKMKVYGLRGSTAS